MLKLITPVLLLALVLGTVVYLDDTPPDADLVLVNRSDVFTLDPQRQSYIQDFRMTNALYEGLLRWDNHDFSVHPAGAAAAPTVSEDGRTLTFALREDARWSTGEPVTAHDYRYAFRRLLLPDTAADYSNLFFVVDGAEAFWRWRRDETSAFAANPWATPEPDAAAVTHFIHRLRSLLDAPELPSAIALPPRESTAALVRTLDHLAAIADEHPALLAEELAAARSLRGLHAALDAPESRATEAAWRWSRVDARFDALVGVEVVDDFTLRLRLGRPCAYIDDLLAFGVCFPVHRPSVEGWPDAVTPSAARRAGGWAAVPAPPVADCRWVSLDPATGRFKQRHEWARPGRMVTNGPYLLAQWRYKRDLRLEPNPHYHTPDRARAGRIVILTIEDPNTRVLAFETGGLDWLSDVDASYKADMLAQRAAYLERHRAALDELLASGLDHDVALGRLPAPEAGERRDIHAFPTFGTDFYSFNCRPTLHDGRPNPFHDAAVRRAFARAIDKAPIVRSVTRLDEPIATTLIPRGSIPGYDSPAGLPFDADAARAELDAAGWTDRDGDGLRENARGEPFPAVEILYTTNTPRYKWISLNLRDQWEAALGVNVVLRDVDTKFYKEDLKQGKFMIARGNWYGDYGDPTTFLDLCRSTDGNNDRGFVSRRIDDMLDAAARETDPARRMDLLEDCERVLFEEELPMLPICQLTQVYMYEPGRLRGLSRHPRLTQYLWQMESIEP